MQYRLRQRASDEGGFTLIELLVVILIIAILAAIAIPTFLSQKSKAVDVQAKELAQTARTTADTYATDHNGEYTGMTLAKLKEYEPGLQTATSTSEAYLEEPGTGKVTGNSFEVIAVATDGDKYKIEQTSTGVTNRNCTVTTGHEHSGCTAGSW